MKKLIKVQSALKAPKGQENTFGGYMFRSCEDILEAVKPLLAKEELLLTLRDDIIEVGERIYVKATATVTDGTEIVSVTAFAREALAKKKMDESQLTGVASSYARKYALNGLFLIDDTKDSDSTNEHKGSDLVTAVAEVGAAKTVVDLEKVWVKYPDLHANAAFKKAVTNRKREVQDAAN